MANLETIKQRLTVNLEKEKLIKSITTDPTIIKLDSKEKDITFYENEYNEIVNNSIKIKSINNNKINKKILNSSYFDAVVKSIRKELLKQKNNIDNIVCSEILRTISWSFYDGCINVIINQDKMLKLYCPKIKFIGNEFKHWIDENLYYYMTIRTNPYVNGYSFINSHLSHIYGSNYFTVCHPYLHTDIVLSLILNLEDLSSCYKNIIFNNDYKIFNIVHNEVLNNAAYIFRNDITEKYGYHCIDNEGRSSKCKKFITFYDTTMDGGRSDKMKYKNCSVEDFEKHLRELRLLNPISCPKSIVSGDYRNPKWLYITEWKNDKIGISFGKYGFSIDHEKRKNQQQSKTTSEYVKTHAKYYMNPGDAEILESLIKDFRLSRRELENKCHENKMKIKDIFPDGFTETFDIENNKNLYSLHNLIIKYLVDNGYEHYAKNLKIEFAW